MNNQIDKNRYDDIIHLPHPDSSTRARMSMLERAAQFSPFAALTGYDAAIRETARVTQDAAELDEDRKSVLDQKLRMIMECLEAEPQITVTYFRPDDKKTGGTYVDITGIVRKIDGYKGNIVFADGTVVSIDTIFEIEGEMLE